MRRNCIANTLPDRGVHQAVWQILRYVICPIDVEAWLIRQSNAIGWINGEIVAGYVGFDD